MKDLTLTKNFKLSEFTKTDLTEYSLALVKLLAANLQVIRNKLQEYAKDPNKPVTISISSGVRTQADYERLVKNGYNPSKTSDHFAGYQLLSKPTLGAADIKVGNCKLALYEVADLIIQMKSEGEVDVGQVIWEYNPKTKSDWIHIGNDWWQIFDSEFISDNKLFTTRKEFLMSFDNGKTYSKFSLAAIKKFLKG